MDVTGVIGILLLGAGVVLGVLIAPKSARYEASFVSEFHALVAQGALDKSHVKAWYDLLVRKLSAEAQKAELEAKETEARVKNVFEPLQVETAKAAAGSNEVGPAAG